MNESDSIAIALAAERRQWEEKRRTDEEAKRAELGRALREDVREVGAFFRNLFKRAVRRMVGR